MDLNVKILEENISRNLSDLRFGKYFLYLTQKYKKYITNCILSKLKTFTLPKNIVRKIKGKPQLGRIFFFPNHIPNTLLVRKIY